MYMYMYVYKGFRSGVQPFPESIPSYPHTLVYLNRLYNCISSPKARKVCEIAAAT